MSMPAGKLIGGTTCAPVEVTSWPVFVTRSDPSRVSASWPSGVRTCRKPGPWRATSSGWPVWRSAPWANERPTICEAEPAPAVTFAAAPRPVWP